MKVRIVFHDKSDVTVVGADSTETQDGYFMALDADGDKLLVVPASVIRYVEFSYN